MPVLVRSARAVTGDAELADDVLQAVLERVCRAWPRIGAMERRDAYIRRMLVNEFLDHTRHRRRVVPLAEVGTERTAPDTMAARDTRSDLLERITLLPPRQAVAIGLRYYGELSDPEIAEAMGCTAGTVRGYLSRALATLRAGFGAALTV
ncbi:sigma-70 family RNA polymerase sigma factor [Nakamurella sp. UYEF19]|uniref:sigma-70 family RNA polymerase sigma factor n=1 Tax=Nakamurella sp. UYEF19 TaxID=1756392 RepID=UPI0033909C3E